MSLVDYELLSAGASAPALPQVEAVVATLQAGIVARYGEVYHQQLAVADRPILEDWDPRHNKRDTALGNLFTDAYRAAGNTEIAIEALGFLDEGMPAGPIVGADVFRSMAYGKPQADPATGGYIVRPFRLATFRLYGAELLGALEFALASGHDLFPQVSGMQLEFDSSRPPGSSRLVAGTVRVGDQPVSPSQLYTVTGNEGLVMFLSELGLTPHDVQPLDVSAFDAARSLVEARGCSAPSSRAAFATWRRSRERRSRAELHQHPAPTLARRTALGHEPRSAVRSQAPVEHGCDAFDHPASQPFESPPPIPRSQSHNGASRPRA